MLISTVFKFSFQILIGTRDSKSINLIENVKVLIDFIQYFLSNFTQHKTRNFDYKTQKWMNKPIIISLKKGSKFAKIYYTYPPEYNKKCLLNQENKYTQQAFEAKEQKIAK